MKKTVILGAMCAALSVLFSPASFASSGQPVAVVQYPVAGFDQAGAIGPGVQDAGLGPVADVGVHDIDVGLDLSMAVPDSGGDALEGVSAEPGSMASWPDGSGLVVADVGCSACHDAGVSASAKPEVGWLG